MFSCVASIFTYDDLNKNTNVCLENSSWLKTCTRMQFLLQCIYMHLELLRNTHSGGLERAHPSSYPHRWASKVGPINSTWAEREHAGCSIMKYCPPAPGCRCRHRSARCDLTLHHKSQICITNLIMSPRQTGDFKSVRKIVHEYLSTVRYFLFY